MSDSLNLSRRDGRVTITLADASTRNALGLDRMAAFTKLLDEVGSDPTAKVVVIDHEGPAFSAGHDLGPRRCSLHPGAGFSLARQGVATSFRRPVRLGGVGAGARFFPFGNGAA